MKILIIGGTGHVGTFLTPMLVRQGHEVCVSTRGHTPESRPAAFAGVRFLTCDSTDPEALRALRGENFEVVVDFPGTARNTWQAFRDTADHIIACGSFWMWGAPRTVPTPETPQAPCPFPDYALRLSQLQQMAGESGRYRAAFTAIMPTNICGPGKIPLELCGGRSLAVHRAMCAGEPIVLPQGPEALIGPCDAEDLARLYVLAIQNRAAAAGNFFNGGSGHAVTAGEMARIYGEIYGVEIPIRRVPWEVFCREVCPEQGSWWHFYAHMAADISKAQKLLGYAPCYDVQQTLTRAVQWMREKNLL